MTHANLREVDLKGAQLVGANLMRAELAESILLEADLRGANLRATNLEWAGPTGFRSCGGDCTDANLRGAFLGGAHICNTTIPDERIKFTGCSKQPFLEEDTTE